MKVYKLEKTQIVPASLDECWDFFSNPANLKSITPPNMGFEIINRVPNKMYAGQLVQYYVKPILGIKLLWVTEITQVKEKVYFIDEQRFGPYKLWHHQHFFKETTNGIEMRDIVHYIIPFGIIGKFMHWAFINKQLKHIFSFRSQIIQSKFK